MFQQYKTEKLNTKWVNYIGTDTLKQGYCLCYDSAAAVDVDGVTAAEGTQNVARALRVRKPATAYLNYFAGVVPASFDGFTGPGFIEIYEPDGHYLPIFTDKNCTTGDLLFITDGSYYAHASGGSCIGRVTETIDRSSTNGLALIRLGFFIPSATSDAALSVSTLVSAVDAAQSTSISQASSGVLSLSTAQSTLTAAISSSQTSINLIANSASSTGASVALIANSASSTGVVTSSGVVSVAASLSAVKVSASSMKLVYDSCSASQANVKTSATITMGDTAVSTLGSTLKIVLSALAT
jgi:hypothetical protein